MSTSTIVKSEEFFRLFQQAVDGSALVEDSRVVLETVGSQGPEDA